MSKYVSGKNSIACTQNVKHVWMPEENAVLVTYKSEAAMSFGFGLGSGDSVRLDFESADDARAALGIFQRELGAVTFKR